jgi:YVTN family beta-propeller protein
MKSDRTIVLPVILILTMSLSIYKCSLSNGYSTVIINIKSQSTNACLDQSLIDRVLRFFAAEAHAQVPSNVASITVRVTAPDMSTIENSYASDVASIVLEVPSGNQRLFTVEAKDSANELLYAGTSRVSLRAGESNTILITMQSVLGKIYVANSGSGNISVINGLDNTINTTVSAGASPYAIAINQTSKKIYISNIDSNNVTVIDGNTDTPIATLTADFPGSNYDSGGIAINLNTNKIYVSMEYDAAVSVFNGATNTLISGTGYPIANSLANMTYPSDIKINTVTNKIYVADWGGSQVFVINSSTDAATPVTDLTSLIDNNYGIAINQNTNRIYTTNNYGDDISVINGATDTVIQNIAAGGSPVGIDINPVTNRIYVANSGDGTVTVIDGNTNSLVTTITVGATPTGVAVNSAANRIYVTNSGSGTVSVISGTTNTVITTVTVGTAPAYLSILQ